MTTPFRQIEPQPARGKFKEALWTDPNWVAEEKYDGDRRIAQFIGDLVRFTGRRQSVDGSGFVEKSANVPHLSGVFCGLIAGAATAWRQETWRNPNVPSLEGTVLDGEMVYTGPTDGGGRSKYVTAIMGSLPDEAVRKQAERGWLEYVVFDCLYFKGEDVRERPYRERHKLAGQALSEWRNPYASLARVVPTTKKEFYEEILAREGEGIILKNLDQRYGQKTKWVKVKGTWNADVVVMGYKSAKELSVKKGEDAPTMTKYATAGLIGAVTCGQYRDGQLVEVAAISGMDDALRASFSNPHLNYLGRVIEIAHNGREPTGRFRHPRFKGFRDDKPATACVYDLDER